MGEVQVPADARWGAQTPARRRELPHLRPAHRAGADRGAGADQGRGRARERPAEDHRQRRGARPSRTRPTRSPTGAWDDHFPIDVYQTGSGTSSNMNTNEVLANLASERARQAGAPERRRQRRRSRRTTCSRRPSTSPRTQAVARRPHPGARAAGQGAAQEAATVQDGGEVGAHPPHGRHARHPGPGVRRLRRRGRARHRAPAKRRCPRLGELPLGGTAVGTGHQRAEDVRRAA